MVSLQSLQKGGLYRVYFPRPSGITNMKQWHVFVNGDNFLMKSDNKTKKHGFYKWVRVNATSAKEAEERAVKKLRANTLLQHLTTNPRDNPPLLHVKEIWEIPNNKKIKDSVFVFYTTGYKIKGVQICQVEPVLDK